MKSRFWRWLLIVVGGVLIIFIGYFGHAMWQFSQLMDSLGPCGFYSGPFHGRAVEAHPDTLEADLVFSVDGGRIIFVHINDSAGNPNLPAPLIVKLDNSGAVQWAYLFDSVRTRMGLSMEPLEPISSMLNKEFRKIHFFNDEYMEPAYFQFDENWDLECMCQSPM